MPGRTGPRAPVPPRRGLGPRDVHHAPVPEGVDGLSFGLNLREAGTLVTDDYSQEVDITWDEFVARTVGATWGQVCRIFTAPADDLVSLHHLGSLQNLASPW